MHSAGSAIPVALSLITGVFALMDFLPVLLTQIVGVRPALPYPTEPVFG